MNNEPLVSICIPTYNGEKFIKETLISIVNQTYSNLEILISDHSSSDNTISIIESFHDDRILLSSLSSGGRVADNWNASVAKATGTFVKLVCQDDILRDNCIELQVKQIQNFPSAAFCFSPRDIISPKGRPLIKDRGYKPKTAQLQMREHIAELVRSGTNFFGEPCAVLMDRSALLSVGVFEGSYLIDLDMWVRLWSQGEAVFFPKSLSKFRINRNSWSMALSHQQAEQIVTFLTGLQSQLPELISEEDVNFGVQNALKLERQRKFLTRLIERLHY